MKGIKHQLLIFRLILPISILLFSSNIQNLKTSYLPIGFSLGDVSFGERIITFHRLFPVNHPEAKGHVFPTATQYSKNEVEVLLHLGEQIGWNLYSTLYRHPTYPSDSILFPEFNILPVERIKQLDVVSSSNPALAGLKVACFLDGNLVAYILDTRGVPLEARGIRRPVAGGYDMPRDEFISRINESLKSTQKTDVIIVFQ